MTTLEQAETFHCCQCGQSKPLNKDCGTGYGLNAKDEKVCYACCGDNDRAEMLKTGKAVLYLTITPMDGIQTAKVSNWPGSLAITAGYRKGRHNIAGSRYDVWFRFEGQRWHGVTYGDNTQICHCHKLKG